MYEGGVDKGQDPDLLSRIILHEHDPFPVSPIQVEDSGIHFRRIVVVHTYDFHEEERGEETHMEQLWAHSEGYSGP